MANLTGLPLVVVSCLLVAVVGSSSQTPSPSTTPWTQHGQNETQAVCGGAKAFPCTEGCTYIHKANQNKCDVGVYGCYDCASLPKTCPDCTKQMKAHWDAKEKRTRTQATQNATQVTCGGAKTFPCTSGCTYIHKANQDKCRVGVYGCYDCTSLPKTCPDCTKQMEAHREAKEKRTRTQGAQNVTEVTCGGAKAFPCTKGCTYIHKANQQKCAVGIYGCYDCTSLPNTCPDCAGQAEALVVFA